MNEPKLAVVDFDDIYEELRECEEDLPDSDSCMRFLKESKNPNVGKWIAQIGTNDDVTADIIAIIYHFLGENDEYI